MSAKGNAVKRLEAALPQPPARERAALVKGTQRRRAAIRLQQAREAAGLTQEEVAARMGVSQANLSRMEHRTDVKLSNIRRYVEALGGRLEMSMILPDRRLPARHPASIQHRTQSGRAQAQQRIPLINGDI